MSSVIRLFTVFVLGTLLVACSSSSDDNATPSRRPTEPAPEPTPEPRAENVAFWYQRIDATTDLAGLGNVRLVVTVPQAQSRDAIAQIHAIGAKAYRYVQFYWYPEGREHEGLDIGKRLDWAFCASGAQPAVGREVPRRDGVERWYFLDANEQGVREQVGAFLRGIRAEGWDGIMFDRGFAALTGSEASIRDVWASSSQCTDTPVEPGRTFADAYVGLVAEAKQTGLEVLLNYGLSSVDPVVPMRPDPRDPDCPARAWARCSTLDDVWPHVDWTLDEAIAHPRDEQFSEDLAALSRITTDSRHPNRVIGLITAGTLGGEFTRDNVFFQWARVKLFPVPLAVGTGDDGCRNNPDAPICNRHGSFPELANAALGAPTTARPEPQSCEPGSNEQCLWVRKYQRGMVVVNVSPVPKRLRGTALRVAGCRVVTDVYADAPIANGRCVTAVDLELPAWSGRVLTYAAPTRGA